MDVAASNGDFSLLVAALQKANLVETLKGTGPFTVFAPTNQAFTASGITNLDDFSAEELREILLYHVIENQKIDAASIQAGPVEMAANLTAFVATTGGVALNGGNAQVGGADVTTADVLADNGIIHFVDRVLLPPDIPDCANYGGLSSLVGAIATAADIPGGSSLLETLEGTGPFTVFAPTNEAFGAITVPSDPAVVRDILLYHVLDKSVPSTVLPTKTDTVLTNRWDNGITLLIDTSDGVKINGGNVALADIKCTNGTVHVIDKVLLPPNVVDMAGLAGLNSLVGAVTSAADLPGGISVANALAADEPYTVFAPNDAAFAAINVTPSPEDLRDILLLHVVNAGTPVLSTGLPATAEPLLTGEVLTFNPSRPSVSSDGTDDALIIITDVNVTNGVIHVVDKVLLP